MVNVQFTTTTTANPAPGQPVTWLFWDRGAGRMIVREIPNRRPAIHDKGGSYFVRSYELGGK